VKGQKKDPDQSRSALAGPGALRLPCRGYAAFALCRSRRQRCLVRARMFEKHILVELRSLCTPVEVDVGSAGLRSALGHLGGLRRRFWEDETRLGSIQMPAGVCLNRSWKERAKWMELLEPVDASVFGTLVGRCSGKVSNHTWMCKLLTTSFLTA